MTMTATKTPSEETVLFKISDRQDPDVYHTVDTISEVAEFASELWWESAPRSVKKALRRPNFKKMKRLLLGSDYLLEKIVVKTA